MTNAVFENTLLDLPTDQALKLLEEDYPKQSPLFYLSVLNRIRCKHGRNPITSVSRALASTANGRKGGRKKTFHTIKLTGPERETLEAFTDHVISTPFGDSLTWQSIKRKLSS